MKQKKAYCPASITLLFRVHKNEDPMKTGSTGVSFTVNCGVTATVSKSDKTAINWNEKEIVFPTVAEVIKKLTSDPVQVYLSSPLPLGCGFGLSSASALSTASAISSFLKLNITPDELAKICYRSEIINKTGLGSVVVQSTGGFLVRTSPDNNSPIKKLPFTGKKIFAIIFKSLETPGILKNASTVKKISAIGKKYLDQINNHNLSLNEFFDIGYQFAKETGLLQDNQATELIEKIRANGGHATMTMMGQVVLSTTKPDDLVRHQVITLQITDDTI